jgi:electron transfer flavoprotein beta subunit
MKAKKKEIAALTPAELGVDTNPRLEVLKVEEPPARAAGVRLESAEELVDRLRNKEGVI